MSNTEFKLVIYTQQPPEFEERPAVKIGCNTCPLKNDSIISCGGAPDKTIGDTIVPENGIRVLGIALFSLAKAFMDKHFAGHKGTPPSHQSIADVLADRGANCFKQGDVIEKIRIYDAGKTIFK